MHKLQYISQGDTKESQLINIKNALEHGAKWIQLRWKNATNQELLALAIETKSLCQIHNATFIINDDPFLAKECNADGVHLGLEDMDINKAKEILGKGKIIGGTANTLDNVLQRINEKCDYIGLGPLRFTKTKEKLSPTLGFEGYSQIINSLKKQNLLDTPIFAIGGINTEDIPTLLNTGIYGIAVSKIITDNPKNIQKILNQLQ